MSDTCNGPGHATLDHARHRRAVRHHHARPGRDRKWPGSTLIAVAAWLLALTGGGALFVSFSAQYAYVLAVRRQDAASVIEALLLDLLMIVFTLLALGLARAGQPARTERALILLCGAASSYMNVSAADVASPRSVAAYAVAPVALAVVVDRVGGGDPPPRPGRRGAFGLDNPGPRRGGRGQDYRAGAAVSVCGSPWPPPRPPEACAGWCWTPLPFQDSPKRPRLRHSNRPLPRRPLCSPCTALTRATGTAAEPAGSPPNWPRRPGCKPEPPAATCTPSWTAGHHDRGSAR